MYMVLINVRLPLGNYWDVFGESVNLFLGNEIPFFFFITLFYKLLFMVGTPVALIHTTLGGHTLI